MNIIVAILIFGLIVLVHEYGHFIVAVKNGILVEEFAIGMGPKLAGIKRGDTLYSIRLLPFGGYCKMLGEDQEVDDKRSFSSQSVWARIAVVVAGPFFNFILAFVFAFIFTIIAGNQTTVIDSIVPDSPAQQAGLMPEDKIIKVNGHRLVSFKEMKFYISEAKGQVVTIQYSRDGVSNTINIVPMETEDGSWLIGISPKSIDKGNIFQVIKASFLEMVFWIKMVFISLASLIAGNVSAKQLSGPVGIVGFISQGYKESVKNGLLSVIQTISFYIVLLSANLGIVNLLPIPALDGGRLVFLLIEAVRGKPINQKREGFVHFIGFVLLMVLMVFMVFNDARNWFF